MKSGPFAFPCPGTTCVRPSPCRSHRVHAVSSATVGNSDAATGETPVVPGFPTGETPVVPIGEAALSPLRPTVNGRDARCPSTGAATGRARAPRAPPGARSARSHSTVRVPSSRSSSNACSKAFRISGKLATIPDIHSDSATANARRRHTSARCRVQPSNAAPSRRERDRPSTRRCRLDGAA